MLDTAEEAVDKVDVVVVTPARDEDGLGEVLLVYLVSSDEVYVALDVQFCLTVPMVVTVTPSLNHSSCLSQKLVVTVTHSLTHHAYHRSWW